jgi:hypothetical protein
MLEGEGFRIKVEVLLAPDLKLDWSERLIRISDIVEKMEERGGRFRTGDVNLTFENSDGYFEETNELWQEYTWMNREIQITLVGVDREWEEILFWGYLQRKENRGNKVMFKARDLVFNWLQGLITWRDRDKGYPLVFSSTPTGNYRNEHENCLILKIDEAVNQGFWSRQDKSGFENFWFNDANWETVAAARYRNREPDPLQNAAEIFFDLMTHNSPTGVLLDKKEPEKKGWEIARGVISPWIWFMSWMKMSMYPIDFERTLTADKEWKFFDLLEELTRPFGIAFYMKAGKVAFDAIEPELMERSFFLPRDWIREEEKDFDIQDMFNSVLWKIRRDDTEHFHYSPGFGLSKEKFKFVRTFEVETGWITFEKDISDIAYMLDRFAERVYAKYGVPVENRKMKIPVGIFESRLNDLVEVQDPWKEIRRFRIFEIRKKFFPSEVTLTLLPADEYWQKWAFYSGTKEGMLEGTPEYSYPEGPYAYFAAYWFKSKELDETVTWQGTLTVKMEVKPDYIVEIGRVEATSPTSFSREKWREGFDRWTIANCKLIGKRLFLQLKNEGGEGSFWFDGVVFIGQGQPVAFEPWIEEDSPNPQFSFELSHAGFDPEEPYLKRAAFEIY